MKTHELNMRLAPIALAMGVETLALDDEGSITLISDEVEILIEADEDSDSVFLTAWLGSAPPVHATNMLEQMLRANVLTQQTAGAALGMDRELNAVVLSLRLSGAELRAEDSTFQERLMAFMEAAEYWAFMISQEGQDASSSDADEAQKIHLSTYRG